MNPRIISAYATSLNKEPRKKSKEQPKSYSQKKIGKLVEFLETKRKSGQEYVHLKELLLFISHLFRVPLDNKEKEDTTDV